MSLHSFKQKKYQQNNKPQMSVCLQMSLKAYNQQHNAC